MYKRKPSRRSGKTLAVMVPALLAATAWSFGQATFQQTTGSQSWNTAANWSTGTVPSGPDVAVIFPGATPAAEMVTLGAAQTVGSFTIHDSTAFGLTISGTSTQPLTFSASSGTATGTVDQAGTATNTVSAPVVLTSSLDLTVSNTTATSVSGAITFTGAMTGTGGFIKDGDGTVSMTNTAKAYTGATVVNAGVLRISFTGEANATSALTVNSGGQFRLDSSAGTFQVGSSASTVITLNGAGDTNLTGTAGLGALGDYVSGASTLTNAVQLASASTIYLGTTTGISLTLSGVVSSTGALTKTGTGSLILNNASNSYSGGTIVSAGTLLVNAGVANTSSAAGTGAITVNSGTLGGSGNISGAVTVTGGTLLAGSGATGTTLTLSGNLDTTAQGTVIGLTLGPSGAHSTLARAGGNWTFNSAQVFTLLGAPAVGTYTDVISGLASDPGTESAWTVNNANYVETFTYDPTGTTPGIDLNITAVPVPEPTTVLGGVLLVGLTAWTRRRRLGGALGLPA